MCPLGLQVKCIFRFGELTLRNENRLGRGAEVQRRRKARCSTRIYLVLGMGQREKVWYRSGMRLGGRGLDLEKRK